MQINKSLYYHFYAENCSHRVSVNIHVQQRNVLVRTPKFHVLALASVEKDRGALAKTRYQDTKYTFSLHYYHDSHSNLCQTSQISQLSTAAVKFAAKVYYLPQMSGSTVIVTVDVFVVPQETVKVIQASYYNHTRDY